MCVCFRGRREEEEEVGKTGNWFLHRRRRRRKRGNFHREREREREREQLPCLSECLSDILHACAEDEEEEEEEEEMEEGKRKDKGEMEVMKGREEEEKGLV